MSLFENAAYAPHCALISGLLLQLSQVYSMIKMLSLVVPLHKTYLEDAVDNEQIEAYIMGCVHHDEIGGWKQRRKSGKKSVRILLGTLKKFI